MDRNLVLRWWPYRPGRIIYRMLLTGVLASLFPAACAVPEEDGSATTAIGKDCGDVTYYGTCDDEGRLLWCDGELLRQDCPSQGKICGPTGWDTGYFCREPCGEITEAGSCDGNTLVWCHAGGINRVDCGKHGGKATGAVCAWNSEDCVAQCLGCGDLTEKGTCDGEVVRYCDDGVPRSIDCAAYEKHCGVDEKSGYATCLPITPPETCEPGVTKSSCTEEGLYAYCGDDGAMVYYSCEEEGLECAHDETLGWTGCRGCADVDWWEEPCMWGWRRACESNFMWIEPCEEVCDAPK